MKHIKLLLIIIVFLFVSSGINAPLSVDAGEYDGKTFVIDLSQGGFNYNQNADNVPPTMMVEGSRNINIHQSGRAKRGGTDNVNGTAISGTPRIYGVYQFRLQNGNTFILTATSDGKILKDYTTVLKTGLTINRVVYFITFNNLCIICTGNDLPQIWDGVAGFTTDIVNEAVDWAAGNYPRKMIKHGRGASERLWAIYGKTDPFTVYASDLNAGDGTTEPDFVTGVLIFYISTTDGFGIINGVEYGDRLILSGKTQTYLIDDLDVDTANWGYAKAQWEGGTGSDRLLIAVENDLFSFSEDGTISSVIATQNYGDYARSSFTRAAYIDEWIRDNIKLSSIDDFHATYDPVLRCVYFFVVRQGQTEVDTALCYFIDRGPDQGWIIKDNLSADSGFNASCSTLVRKDAGDYKIYTGGWGDGYVWELETTNQNDNGAAYASGFKTVNSHFGMPRRSKLFDAGWIVINKRGNYNLLVDIWVDGIWIKQESVSLAGIGSTYGGATYGVDASAGSYGGVERIEESFGIGKVGKRLQYEVHNGNVDEDFFVTAMMTDFTDLGRRP